MLRREGFWYKIIFSTVLGHALAPFVAWIGPPNFTLCLPYKNGVFPKKHSSLNLTLLDHCIITEK